MRESIYILIATYNATPYLLQQVESICTQSKDKSFSILIRDDASHDDTIELLQKLVQQYNNIYIVKDNLGQLGATGNFSRLLEVAHANGATHCLCADQDDVWMEDKIALQTSDMEEMKNSFSDQPLLVYSDMQVVDASLNEIAPSFMRYLGIQHETNALSVLLTQNFITGCTMMVNRPLLELALPIPEEALMHDWWLALCAAVFGHISYIDQPLVKYRQHDSNEVGAKHLADFINPMTEKWKTRWFEGRENLFQSMKQAKVLAERIRQNDPKNKNVTLVEAYAALQDTTPFQRVRKLKQLGVHAQSKSRQALLLSRLLLTPKI